jgi:hypothetical protein
MPVEIRELVIRTTVSSSPPAESLGESSMGSAVSRGDGGEGTDAIVQACVREVLRVLRQGRER